MRCPSYDVAELVHDTRDMSYTYKGKTTIIPSVIGEFCPACDEIVLEREQDNRYGELVSAFQRQANATYVDPTYIAAVRRKLSLDQREATEVFGDGANVFSRHETGKTKPSLALVRFLKLFDRHLDSLAETKTA